MAAKARHPREFADLERYIRDQLIASADLRVRQLAISLAQLSLDDAAGLEIWEIEACRELIAWAADELPDLTEDRVHSLEVHVLERAGLNYQDELEGVRQAIRDAMAGMPFMMTKVPRPN